MSKDERVGARIVVIGGGTGSFALLSGLKNYARHITALVNMADDGGSTGILRDELGALPPGDVRQCLVALSNSPQVRDLFNYRFEEGTLKGHAFGNLFLTALEKMTGNFGEAVELASEVLNISGRVEPITLDNVTLCLDDGDKIPTRGEFEIAHMTFKNPKPRVWLEPTAKANPRALEAIAEADIVIIAPGNLYGSLAPALIVPGLGKALSETPAKKVYVSNLVTKPGQTDGLKVHDFAAEIERLIGSECLDYVLYNTSKPSDDLLGKYAKDGEYAIDIDEAALKNAHYRAKGADLLADTVWQGAQSSDPIASARSFIRHDPDKIARQLMKIYFS
jgi:uncharacterized cofD-like protein